MCVKCRRVIDGTFKYCPHCGQRQDAGSAWYYHPVLILLLAFCVLGPFALPLLWRSPRMSTTGKAISTAAILAYTAYCFYLGWKIVAMELKFSTEFTDILRHNHLR